MVRAITIWACLILGCCLLFAQSHNGGFLQHRRTASRPPPTSGSTPAFVDWTNGVAGNVNQIPMTNNVASGNTCVVWVGWEDADATWSVTDSAGNTYTAMQKTNSGTLIWGQVFRAINITGASPLRIIPTNNQAGTSPGVKASMLEFSGVTAFDVAFPGATNGNDVSHVETTSATTANAIEALYAFAANYNGASLTQSNVNWSVGYNTGGSSSQYRITSSAGSYNATVTNSGTGWGIIIGGALK